MLQILRWVTQNSVIDTHILENIYSNLSFDDVRYIIGKIIIIDIIY